MIVIYICNIIITYLFLKKINFKRVVFTCKIKQNFLINSDLHTFILKALCVVCMYLPVYGNVYWKKNYILDNFSYFPFFFTFIAY